MNFYLDDYCFDLLSSDQDQTDVMFDAEYFFMLLYSKSSLFIVMVFIYAFVFDT